MYHISVQTRYLHVNWTEILLFLFKYVVQNIRCENDKKRRFGGSCFAAWNIISAKDFFAESLWFIDDQGPHFEGMIASTINTWLFSKNCVAYLRFFEIFAWNFFGTKCYIRFNMFNFAVSAATSSTFKYKRNSKASLSLRETMQKARKNLATVDPPPKDGRFSFWLKDGR